MSDTPRTDAAEYESIDEPVAKLGAVDADFARQLERELNAANDRIKLLEDRIERASAAFFTDGSDRQAAGAMLAILEEERMLAILEEERSKP